MLNVTFRRIINKLPYDERLKFHDLSKIKPERRIRISDTLNFYSSNNNIGNFTPLMGIHKFLNQELDVWCAHDKNIDWLFINKNYKRIIIGGAGLFHKSFTHFWEQIVTNCKIPFIVWGVGGIFPKNNKLISNVDDIILKKALKRADLINLRDDLSANLIDIDGITISPCPTILYMNDLRSKIQLSKKVLYSSHEELLSIEEKDLVKDFLNQRYKYTFNDNIQYQFFGMNKVLSKYLNVNHVITTRLHGAIIAYGLGIPYTAISFDNKVDEFHRLYGNGTLIKDLNEIKESSFYENELSFKLLEPNLYSVNIFGKKVSNWIKL